MKKILASAVLLTCGLFAGGAGASPVPKDFLGDWVPQKSVCGSPLKLRVTPTAVELINGRDTQLYGKVETCLSCEGGAKYDGIVVWLFPTMDETPFYVRFNSDEKPGVTQLEMDDAALAKRFPFQDRPLRKCTTGAKER